MLIPVMRNGQNRTAAGGDPGPGEAVGLRAGSGEQGDQSEGELRAMVTGQFAKKGQQATLSLNVGGTADASFTIMWKESRDGGTTWEDYIEANIGERHVRRLFEGRA